MHRARRALVSCNQPRACRPASGTYCIKMQCLPCSQLATPRAWPPPNAPTQRPSESVPVPRSPPPAPARLATGIYTIQAAVRAGCTTYLSGPACGSNTLQMLNADTGAPGGTGAGRACCGLDAEGLCCRPSVQGMPCHHAGAVAISAGHSFWGCLVAAYMQSSAALLGPHMHAQLSRMAAHARGQLLPGACTLPVLRPDAAPPLMQATGCSAGRSPTCRARTACTPSASAAGAPPATASSARRLLAGQPQATCTGTHARHIGCLLSACWPDVLLHLYTS